MKVAAQTDSDALGDPLDRDVALMVVASSEALRKVAAYDEETRWARDGATSMTNWLAGRYGLGWGTAREWVRVAHALRVLPRIAEAYASSRLSWDQLRPLTRFATPESDEYWARRAPSLRPWSLHREAERHHRVDKEETEDVHRERSIAFWWDEERPLLYLEGRLPAEEGAAVKAALERRAEEIVLADHPDSPQEARLADALVELVTGDEKAPVPTLVVHADAWALTGEEKPRGPWLSETETGHRISSEAVRRLACDSRIDWVLERDGRPVGIGRRGRSVPGNIGRLLRHRDGTCRFPGCERKRWLKAHHLIH